MSSEELTVRPDTLRAAAGAARTVEREGTVTAEQVGRILSRIPAAMADTASAARFAQYAGRLAENLSRTMQTLREVADRLDAAAGSYDKTDAGAAKNLNRIT